VAKATAQACVRRLAALGPYRFRSSRVETMRFTEPDWVGAEELIARLESLRIEDRSGDVYARLVTR
jgi:hypothetical protein